MILIICAAYSFLGNSALLGPSVYIGIYSELFGITPAKASGLISYPNLAYGFGASEHILSGVGDVYTDYTCQDLLFWCLATSNLDDDR